MKKLLVQLIKFGFVGVVASVVDMCILILLKEVFDVDELIASAISFSVSVTANYILSMRFVFKGKGQSKTREFIIFVALSIGGLCINQIIMWIGVKKMSFYYLAVKIFAMIFVTAYTFATRKMFLERKNA